MRQTTSILRKQAAGKKGKCKAEGIKASQLAKRYGTLGRNKREKNKSTVNIKFKKNGALYKKQNQNFKQKYAGIIN
jgi:hypothetical protein